MQINMSTSVVGLLAGLMVAIAAAAGGFTGFLLALLLGLVGFVAGAQLDGRVDLGELLKSRRG